MMELGTFSTLYGILAVCFVSPPPAFVNLGLTVQNMFSDALGEESEEFVYYHLRRTTATICSHAALAAGYVGMVHIFYPESIGLYLLWGGYLVLAICIMVWARAGYYSASKFEAHPALQSFKHIVRDWRLLVDSVSTEYRVALERARRGEELALVETLLGNNKLVITDNWVAYCTAYDLHLAHQRDIDMSIVGAEDIPVQDMSAPAQVLAIKVTSVHAAQRPFVIRMRAEEFERAQAKLHASIRNVKNVVIMQSVSDRFMQEFLGIVKENTQQYGALASSDPQAYTPLQDMVPANEADDEDACAGCMNRPATVVIRRMCPQPTSAGGSAPEYGDNNRPCTQCACTRPMWCTPCLAKWFGSKQNQFHPEGWLAGKAPCPTCRAVFCVFDVCDVAQT